LSIRYHLLTHAGIQSLHPYVPGKAIEELAREKGLTDIIKLASNENPFGCSPKAQQALAEMTTNQLALYPSAVNHPLYEKLAAEIGIHRSRLLISSGSDYIFWFLLTCFALGQKKPVLTHQYAFITYAIQAQTLGIPVVTTRVNADYQVDIDAIINACRKQAIALVFIANPNNPTGILIPKREIERLLAEVPSETIVVLDEAYHEYAYPDGDKYSLNLQANFSNLVITRTFSKVYGLASVRLGYAIADPAIIELLLRVQLPFTVSQPALVCAEAALMDQSFIKKTQQGNIAGMAQMREGLNNLGVSYLPSHTNFLTIDCGTPALAIYEKLLDHGVIVRPLTPYGLMNHLRVTIGTHEQNTRFLTEFKKILRA
jgi:histidinol-phosphate aminotransferase